MSITILPQSLRRLFRASNCPRDQLLAAYADQQLIGNERHLVEEHLTSCDACLGQVAFLVRSESAPPSHTPDDILRTALNHRGSRGSTAGYSWRWLATASAVAVIGGVALVVTWQKSQMLASRSNSASRSTEVSSSREIPLHPGDQIRDDKMRGDDEVSDSTLISPSPNATIDARNVEFRWKARQDASFYEIELVSESGDLIWQGRSNALSMTLPAQIHLESGKGYYVWIRTHMAHGAVEQSRAVRFTVS
jgi:putative zinc finger protein